MNFKTVIDISMDLNEKTVVWTQDPQPKLIPVARKPKAPVNFTWLDFGSHAGTHVDAPYYMYSDHWTIDKIPFDRLLGPCQVMDLTTVKDMIDVADLEKQKITKDKVLLKTKNSFDPMEKYNPDHVAMTESAARYFLDHGVTTLGYDYQSFERGGAVVIHDIFLSRDITVIDNLRLGHVKPGEYTLICLPVKITGIDAAPTRAVLIKE